MECLRSKAVNSSATLSSGLASFFPGVGIVGIEPERSRVGARLRELDLDLEGVDFPERFRSDGRDLNIRVMIVQAAPFPDQNRQLSVCFPPL